MRKMIKKTLILCFVALGLFVLVAMLPKHIKSIAADYDKYPSWQRSSLGLEPIKAQSIDSKYRLFSEIAYDASMVDLSKIYVIQNALDLYLFSEATLGPDKTLYLSLDYVLGNHIDYYDIVLQSIAYRFHPIGFTEPFTGTFDGQGFDISNLYFQTILDEQTYNQTYSNLRYFSMFSMVSETGVIKNFGLINPIMIQPIDWGIMQYASPLVGENRGLVEHVYVIDQRREAAGFHVEGDMHLSGMISVNLGTVKDAFLSTPRVRALGISNLTSTHALIQNNQGVTEHLYYDASIFVDRHATTTNGLGLLTSEFQDPSYFSNAWFFNAHYEFMTTDENQKTQYSLYHTYPILRGLSYDNEVLKIYDAIDLVYMHELFKVSGAFRSSHYEIQKDIDMNQVSPHAYVPSNQAFTGMITGKIQSLEDQLFTRDATTGGDILYPAIIDLSIEKASTLGNFASYAWLTSLFGTVKNLNFVNFNIQTGDIKDYHNREMILIGGIAGQMNRGVIDNVHMDVSIHVTSSDTPSTRLYVGGMVGEGSGTIKHATTTGDIIYDLQQYQTSGDFSATSAIIGHGKSIELKELYSDMSLAGISYQEILIGTHYLGGMMGTGPIKQASELVYDGMMVSQANGFIKNIYMAGIFGYLNDQESSIKNIHNQAELTVNLNQVMQVYATSIANIHDTVKNDQAIFNYQSITNHGEITLAKDALFTLTTQEIEAININIPNMFNLIDVDIYMHGLFNYASSMHDISLVKNYAGLIQADSLSFGSIIQAYQLGDITLNTDHVITSSNMTITAGVLGGIFDLHHLRNEGHISLNLSKGSSLTSGTIKVLGLFEQTYDDIKASYIYNGGNIEVIKTTSETIYHNLFVSGIAYKHQNKTHLLAQGYDSTSLNDITHYEGAMNQILNKGNILISGDFYGHTKASGILIYNEALLTNVTNLGNITQEIHVLAANKEVASSGVLYAQIGEHAWLKDIVNSGDITAISKTTLGFAHASGILVRNDILENHTFISQGSLHKNQKITFAMNQGHIYAWSEDASLIAINEESKTKAAGIMTLGMSSLINVINYGDVYSKYVGSGILAFLYLNRFGALPGNLSLYFGNLINYGRIRKINAYTTAFDIDYDNNPTRTVQNAYGSIFGKFHSNATSLNNTNYEAGWTFLSIGTTLNKYPIDYIDFKNIYNFDPKNDVLGNASGLSLHQQAIQNGEGNSLILNIISQLNTLNPNDQSKAPFNQFAMNTQSKTTIYGKKITSYTLDDSSDGVFYTALTYGDTGTEQYSKDFVIELKRNDIASNLLNRLESSISNTYFGIYALTSSEGIHKNLYLPYHMDIHGMHPLYQEGIEDETWLGSLSDETSINYLLYVKTTQKNNDPASFVFDLELKETDAFGNPMLNGLTLGQPEIDEERRLLTYYLPNNYEILTGQTENIRQTYGYYETSLGTNKGKKIPYINQGGSWDYKVVGSYKKNTDGTFSEIGPYHSDGMYNMNFVYNSNPKDSSNLLIEDAIYFMSNLSNDGSYLTNVYKHSPHFYYKVGTNNESWINEPGYSIVRSSITYDARGGYLPYRRVDQIVGPPNYESLFYYVGPNEELITYDLIYESNHVIYETPQLYFGVNIDSDEHVLSSGASLTYLNNHDTSVITLPKAYGAYDVLYDSTTHEVIDRTQDHYGHVRVYGINYDEEDPSTYRDYEIRIIRTSDQEVSHIESLMINGENALPTVITDFREIIATKDIFYKKLNLQGTLEVTYQVNNMKSGVSILEYVSLTDMNPSSPSYLDKIDPNLYVLKGGVIEGDQSFDQSSGYFGSGTVTISFEVTNLLPSGTYQLEIDLPSGEHLKVQFDKILSSESNILKMMYQAHEVIPSGLLIEHEVPYGMYYVENDMRTKIVDFSNLSMIEDVTYLDLATNYPSYLEGMEISPFAQIESVNLSITQSEDFRYVYDITYIIQAEDGTESTYIHRLKEHVITSTPFAVYKNGGLEDFDGTPIEIYYTEAPTVRIEFDLEDVFVKDLSVIQTTSIMTPFGHDEAVINEDYYINLLLGIGYEVDFNRHIPLGNYAFYTTYQQEVSLWGYQLSWSFDFDSISMDKIQNNNSLISDILFISDTIYSGFNTIIDYEPLNEDTYVLYMEHPSLRRINVLPTKGIYYGYYAEEPSYWIVGQVQETNLTYYQPTFTLPEGGIIRRVTDLINVGPEYQSEDLNADFSPFGESFNFILYRVYAHDYDPELKPLSYTNYYVAVQDITNNIRLSLSFDNQSSVMLDNVFANVSVYQHETAFGTSPRIIEMAVHASYDLLTSSFKNYAFQTSMSGYYVINVSLPHGLTYYILVNDVLVSGHAVTLETAILPKRYLVKVIIVDSEETIPWGEQTTYIFDGNA